MFAFLKLFNLKEILISCAIVILAFGVGVGTGYYTKSKFVAADSTKIVVEARKTDVVAVEQAKKADVVIATKQEKNEKSNVAAKKAFRKIQKEKPNETNHSVVGDGLQPNQAEDCLRDHLSVADTRLFNLAAVGATDYSSIFGDAEAQACSVVTREAFGEHTLDLTKLYRDLAESHESLVDYVEKLQADQKARLGLK